MRFAWIPAALVCFLSIGGGAQPVADFDKQVGDVLKSVSDVETLLQNIQSGATQDEKLSALASLKARSSQLTNEEELSVANRLPNIMQFTGQPTVVRAKCALVLGEMAASFKYDFAKQAALRGMLDSLERCSSAFNKPEEDAYEGALWRGLAYFFKDRMDHGMLFADGERLIKCFYERLRENVYEGQAKNMAMMAFYQYLVNWPGYGGAPANQAGYMEKISQELLRIAQRMEYDRDSNSDYRGFLYLSMVRLCFHREVNYGVRRQMVQVLDRAEEYEPNSTIRTYLHYYVPIIKRINQ